MISLEGSTGERTSVSRVAFVRRRLDPKSTTGKNGWRSGGYLPQSPVVDRLWNLVLVTPLLLLALLPMFVISTLLFITQGRHIFYKGPRLGLNGKKFNIYKFRTLSDTGRMVTSNQVLPSRSKAETKLGKYLRATPLDELPQLINVLKGDMNLLGPRPVREEIAKDLRTKLSNYDVQFGIKPGLAGYTQSLMTHRTDMAIRHRFESFLCRQPVNPIKQLKFLAITAFSVMDSSWSLLFDKLKLYQKKRSFAERRAVRRLRPQMSDVIVFNDRGPVCVAALHDINDEMFTFWSNASLNVEESYSFKVVRRFKGKRTPKWAVCTGSLAVTDRELCPVERPAIITDSDAPIKLYSVRFRPKSALSHYVIDRYMLENSVVF